MNWNNLEPNNSSGVEHYGEIYSSANSGKWNDLPNTSLLGYVVEYGGMSGDPLIQVSAQKNVSIDINYSITYVLDGGTNYINVPSSYTIESDTIILGTPSKIGNDFAGWYDAATGGNKITQITQGSIGNKILYARWTPLEFTVTFKDYNNVELKTETVRYEGTATPPVDPERTGYTFSSWSGSYINVTANKTVTANYSVNTYVIHYKSMGGSVISDANVNLGLKVAKPANPVKAGNQFAGWYKDTLYSSIWDFSMDVMPAVDVTLYAKWISTPAAPMLLAKSATTIELLGNVDNNLEYRMNGGTWHSSTLFKNLKSDTDYLFEVRVAAHELDPSSLLSEPVIIRTNKIYITSSESSNSITGVGDTSFDHGTELVIDNVSRLTETGGSAAYKVNFILADEGKTIPELYDIKLLLEGQPIQPNGMIRIRMKLSADLLAVSEYLEILYINDGGHYEVIPHLIDGDMIVFEVDHLSQYAIVAQANPSDDVSAVAKNSFNTVILIGLVFALIITIFILFWIWKRQKKENRTDEQQN